VQLRTAVARRLHRLVMPLQQSLGVGEVAVLLGMGGRRQEEHLGRDVLSPRLPRLVLGRVLPERRRLDHLQIADDQPVELCQGQADQLRVGGAHGRVLSHAEHAPHPAVEHLQHHGVVGMVAVDPRQVVEAEVVLLAGRVSPPRLQQRHDVGTQVPPGSGLRPVQLNKLIQRRVRLRMGHRDVPGQDVVERRDVG
jgi:hypothetical protein